MLLAIFTFCDRMIAETENIPGRKIILHDQALFYTPRAIQDALDAKAATRPQGDYQFQLLPSYSPDLNLIENVYSSFERIIQPKISHAYIAAGRRIEYDELAILTVISWEELRENVDDP